MSTPANSPVKPTYAGKQHKQVQTQIQFTLPAKVFMTSRRQQRRRDAAHHSAMIIEEQAVLARRTARAARRAQRKAIRKEDTILADAFSAVSVGSSSSTVPVLGAPVKKDIDMRRVRTRIRKPCKKCQERRRKIRQRAEARGSMTITKETPDLVSKESATMNIVQG